MTAPSPSSVSSTAVDDPRDAPAYRPNSGVRRFGKSAWALLIAFIALAGSASSLVFTFLPQLKPDPRDAVLAQLNVFAVDPNVTLGEYLQQAYGGDEAAPKQLRVNSQELGLTGDVVYVRTLVDGFKHRRVHLIATIYRSATQQRFALPPSPSPAIQDARSVTLDTPSTSTVQLFFILNLYGEPPTFVRVEMYDGTRMLAVADSPVIKHNLAPLPPS
jgi:hypothetical protein